MNQWIPVHKYMYDTLRIQMFLEASQPFFWTKLAIRLGYKSKVRGLFAIALEANVKAGIFL
jgi:hypothetical protein